ncbi:MAG: hypothetical protein MUF15_24705 [Acidobacteria bacterium]|nr:hypothetical protein [Acidobacteriota bacterium]
MKQGKRSITTRRLCNLYRDIKLNPHWVITGMELLTGEEKKKIARAKLYKKLLVLMEVPEVAEMITQKLKIAKLIFKDQLRKFNLQA